MLFMTRRNDEYYFSLYGLCLIKTTVGKKIKKDARVISGE